MKTRYLFHSEEATVEDGRFVFSLDKRIHNPVRFRLMRAGFTRTTSTDAAPHAVYLRSDALSELCTRKHVSALLRFVLKRLHCTLAFAVRCGMNPGHR